MRKQYRGKRGRKKERKRASFVYFYRCILQKVHLNLKGSTNHLLTLRLDDLGQDNRRGEKRMNLIKMLTM